ncbi:hypothetical protein C2S53_009934 [Perilla frutescens var. hirtella]|uniref:Cytochrome P450 n=1 Tax=Perilla frutescens var. hirtella TaxID=608512 RepID=A0AAD4J240_PERFH|nr:hypothetical protein C2S53_009934 [Perilla frutescens var. hirtella]
MEWQYFLAYSIIILFFTVFIFQSKSRASNRNRLPPGPRGWPVVGHMFNLGTAPHRTIAHLQPRYGPVVWLKLGSLNTMAVLTAEAAAELFKNHDLSFADRSIVQTMTAHGYHHGSLALAPHGPRWRVLRRLCTAEMFASKRINETAGIRRRCVDHMLSWIGKAGGDGNGIAVGKYAFLAAFNMLGNLMMSEDLVDPESETGTEFYGAMKRVMEWSGKPNVSDLFPWMKWIDLQGLKRKANRDMGIAFGIVKEWMQRRRGEGDHDHDHERDFLDVLLEFDGCDWDSGKLSETEIIIFILEMFLAGTETSSSTIEWAMTELLRNRGAMSKAKSEISSITGKFEENHIDHLPYLQAVVKETLRLHPPIPFLIPRRAIRDTSFMGYLVPKNTQVLVNVWAIGRDPECWEDALCFKPERFLGTNTDYRGQHFELIPFGAGRRVCAGLPLGHRMLHFVLGSLLHEFDWEPQTSLALDMNERMGITVGKLYPLKAMPTKQFH